jgi:hypothetical protein
MRSNNFREAAKGSGIASTMKTMNNYVEPAAVAGRQQARVMKAQADQDLQRIQSTQMSGEDLNGLSEQQSLAIQTATQNARVANTQAINNATYSGFQRYSADGNPQHINNIFETLRKNPVGVNLVSNISRVDKIGPGDDALLKEYGITFADIQANPELERGFLRATMADGTTGILPIDMMHAGTGYDKYKTNQELEEAKLRADIFYKLQSRNSASSSANERLAHTQTRNLMPAGFDEKDWIPGNPEYDAVYIEEMQNLRIRPENQTQTEASATRETRLARPESVPINDWTAGNPEYDKVYQDQFTKLRGEELATSGQKEQASVRATRTTIENKAADDGGFFNIDFAVPANRMKYEQDIQDMMRLGKMELSAEDKRSATYIHELMSLGGTASKLGEGETGIVDRLLRDTKDYVSNNTTGLDLSSSYAAFSNTVRRALYGATLTQGESDAFAEQFGSLKQQAGPVLSKFKVGLTQVRDQLESMMNLGDSYVTHFYLGADQSKLTRMIDALDERIKLIDTTAQRTTGDATVTIDANGNASVNSERPSLDSIFDSVYGTPQQ